MDFFLQDALTITLGERLLTALWPGTGADALITLLAGAGLILGLAFWARRVRARARKA